MKNNIHILPTDKPSELYINMQGVLSKSNSLLLRLKSRHIYITSDEKIKEGDWVKLFVKHIDKNWIHKITKEDLLLYTDFNNEGSKIILTTDLELQKDGIQAIDDEFLEWFIKNPSCEEVEVKCYSKFNDGDFTDYKIIIPKEELKREFVNNTSKWNIEDFEEPKQKTTLEEETIEEYFLSCIKNVLQFGNDAQAIRFMEKYYESKKQQDEK